MSEEIIAERKDRKVNGSTEFANIQIGLASPEKILEWSFGEVSKYTTINYKNSSVADVGGLFDERVFGPTKDYSCLCRNVKHSNADEGMICPTCHVTITSSKVRRERMGHIDLAVPVAHLWYARQNGQLSVVLGINQKQLESILLYNKCIVTHVSDESRDAIKRLTDRTVNVGDIISENQRQFFINRLLEANYDDFDPEMDFEAGMGAGAILKILQSFDVEEICRTLTEKIREAEEAKRNKKKGENSGAKVSQTELDKYYKRLKVFDDFRRSGQKPEWMILTRLPIIPPDLRPMVALEGGRTTASDLNELYKKVMVANEKIKKGAKSDWPAGPANCAMRSLQQAVDALFDNGKRGNRAPVSGSNGKPLKSLTDSISSKTGRFRQNLLGKRVDFSGRSVIVVGPELKIYQCGLPKEMAKELFRPFIINYLKKTGAAVHDKHAKRMIDNGDPEVWDALEVVIKDHPVMLNRAPTLHRLSIQAFEPVLIEGRAIRLHPLVCTAFNADFDGDQMAVHVPLSNEAQAEARSLMLACNNLLKPSDGKSVTVPSQDMVLGSYYLTMVVPGAKGEGTIFSSEDEAVMAYEAEKLDLRAEIKVRRFKEIDGVKKSKIIKTTLGKLIFNRPIPQDLGYVDRTDPEHEFDLEIDFLVGKKLLGKIIDKCISVHGEAEAAVILDAVKAQGYKYSTISGITFAVSDAKIPDEKYKYLDQADKKIAKIEEFYTKGLMSAPEKSALSAVVWADCTSDVEKAVTAKSKADPQNPISIMVDSGARGSVGQLNQVCGMRGLLKSASGKTIEIPVRSSYREGLTMLEYFIAARGARKGLADTALKTSDSGYLTRRLVQVAQDMVVYSDDCGCTEGFEVSTIENKSRVDKPIETFEERLTGRYLLNSIVDETTGEVIMSNDRLMTAADAKRIVEHGITKAVIRSPLTCACKHGVCVKCYGSDLSRNRSVTHGEAVGIIAAQAIGEPGTQLTMRTFHTGGVASEADITDGLPRVEELFECRAKPAAVISEIDGVVSIEKTSKGHRIKVTGEKILENGKNEEHTYPINADVRCLVNTGDTVKMGQSLTFGHQKPEDVLNIFSAISPEAGKIATENYIINEIQKTYRSQGVDINDKHIEIIIRQMFRTVDVVDPGSTTLVPGINISALKLEERVAEAKALAEIEGREFIEPVVKPHIYGISKATINSDSFLAAAAFQETKSVLADAAIEGRRDDLLGISENVLLGRMIPAGTGLARYRNITIEGEESSETA